MKKLWKGMGKRRPQNQGNRENGDSGGTQNQGNGGNRNPGAVGNTVFRVTVPEHIRPGEEFQVYAGNRIVRVRCPMDSQPGQSLQITVPADTTDSDGGNNPPGGYSNSNSNSNSSNNTSSRNGYGGRIDDTSATTLQRSNVRNNNYDNNYGRDSRTTNTNGSGNSSFSPSNPQTPLSSSELLRNGGSGSSSSSSNRQNSSGVRRIAGSNPSAYVVSVPQDVSTGEQFQVTIRGQKLMVTCPDNAMPGDSVRIVPPPLPDERPVSSPQDEPQLYQRNNTEGTGSTGRGPPSMTGLGDALEQQPTRPEPPPGREETQLFEVEVPPGVQPGAPFALLAENVRVLVTCPVNAGPGQKIRFKLPVSLTQQQAGNANSRQSLNEMHQIKLLYDKDGWTRTVRPNGNDFKFQWIRLDANGNIDVDVLAGRAGGRRRFHMDKSAYVRRLEFKMGDDPRIRTGLLSLVPATESVVDSKIKSADGRDLVTYGDLARAQMKSFDEKTEWFQETCAKLCVEWNEGHMRMNIRRQYLLGDSVDAVMSLSRKDLRKLWRFEFIGEMGIDAGGLAREWFELVCNEIFDPDTGLWTSSATNQMSMTINPASEYCCEDHLVFYRFLGRVMGKAMFDRQLIRGHMVKHLYKHILGWPIYFKDLESIDEEYYNNLKQLRSMHENGDDISMLSLDFTMTFEMMGIRKEVELVKGGSEIEVTNENFPEYVEACLKYKLMGCVKPQLNELLLGFFDVIPEPLLTIFDYQELELIMCGLPHIDLDDWKAHTEYSGAYEELRIHHPTVEWFWETLEEFNDEMKARLLLFVTGTSGVPSRGFGVLQSNDGNIRNFTIHGVSAEICFYPRAHTCFNRIDLPVYDSKELLQERLKLAVTMSATGFDIE
eukprot:CAMPEP_0197189868 /NCGR_PEP_ID=MMETSP1423-20130617/20545_1 /TAXON_ID=476441 /ORGANISM="Pseudo-nitzschia heimii, Strain UNC1101" /LENGTH=880 /DNA_ID=CAMNT_0042642105 /DNA_START=453 /DNA_END=3095 /DNA_ORIENTATION=-